MTRVGTAARIKFQGFDSQGVDEFSPLEDQCVLVYKAARRYAEVNGFDPYTHRGVPGLKGPMVMKHLVRDLFPRMGNDELDQVNGLINQVLRKTDAAVCVKRSTEREHVPEWFVADRMPENIVIVALSHAQKSGEQPRIPSQFDEKKYLRREERKLTAKEAGEEITPGEVTVTKTKEKPRPENRLEPVIERRRQWRTEMKQRVLEEVSTNPVPLNVHDVTFYLNEGGAEISDSTVRTILEELVDSGDLVSRMETEDEKRIRGGGKPPAARRKVMFWPAPGPVPTRTRMPDRVPLDKPMAGHHERRAHRTTDVRDLVLECLKDKRTQRPSSISTKLGYSNEHIRNILIALKDEGLVYQVDNGTYKLESRRRTAKAPEKPVETETFTAPEKSTNGTGEDIANPVVGQIMSLVQELAATGVNSSEVESLRLENDRLREENEKLKRAVAGLNQALSALQA